MIIPLKSYAQQVKYIHSSEVWWVLTHPSKAKKAYKISKLTQEIANKYLDYPGFDGDEAGGMVDAFRHCLWMTLLVQEMSPKAALKLGKAHEKGNYKDFKKKRFEEGILPDSVACQMDMMNNEEGLEIGQEFMGYDIDTLVQIVRRAVIDGRCWKIKKDRDGNYLDADDNIIPESKWKGKWNTPKVIVPSDFIRKF